MLIPIIKVKDRRNGNVRIVGGDSHDALIVTPGAIKYLNLQFGEGSTDEQYTDGSGFEFVGVDNGFETVVEFVTLEEFKKLTDYDNVEKWTQYYLEKMDELKISSSYLPRIHSKEEADMAIEFMKTIVEIGQQNDKPGNRE